MTALRAGIEALLAAYVHCIDDDRIEDWPGLFTEDGRYRITTRENWEAGLPLAVMSCQGRGMFADRVSALRTANIYEPHTYCHLTGAAEIAEGGGESVVRSNFAVIRTMASGEMAVFACGRYHDRIVEAAGGQLKFAERVVVCDSRRIDTLLVLPL